MHYVQNKTNTKHFSVGNIKVNSLPWLLFPRAKFVLKNWNHKKICWCKDIFF